MATRSPSEMSDHLDRARSGADRARHQIDELRTAPAPTLPTDLRQRIPGWRQTAEQLRRRLQLADEPTSLAVATDLPAPPERPRRRRRRNWLLTLAVPLLALAVGLVSCLAIRSDDTQQVAPTTIGTPQTDDGQVTAPTATVVPGAQLPPSTAVPAIEPITGLTNWSSAITLSHTGNAARVNDLVAHEGTLYAVGVTYLDEDRRPAVWRSTDGETWELVETTGLDLPWSWMTQAIQVGDRLVAIGEWSEPTASGNKDYHAIGWTSADGVTWTRIEALPATPSYDGVNGLARVGDEAWIVGFSYAHDPNDITRFELGADGTVYGLAASDEQLADADSLIGLGRWGTMPKGSFVLRSTGTDVDDWQPVSMRGMEFTRPEAIGVTGDGTPLVAGTDADEHVRVWQRRADGVWASLPGPVPTSATSASGLIADGDVVVVNVNDPSGAAFTAGAWTTLPGFTIRDVAALEDRFVAVGWSQVGETDDYLAHVAESSDGVTWSGIELPLNQFMSALATFDGRLMAGGSVRGGSDGNKAVPAVWIAGPGDGTVEVAPLTPADWQAPTAPPEPFADVLRYDGSSWVAELTNVDLGAARLSGDVEDLDLDHANDLTVATDGAVWVATELHGVYRLGRRRLDEIRHRARPPNRGRPATCRRPGRFGRRRDASRVGGVRRRSIHGAGPPAGDHRSPGHRPAGRRHDRLGRHGLRSGLLGRHHLAEARRSGGPAGSRRRRGIAPGRPGPAAVPDRHRCRRAVSRRRRGGVGRIDLDRARHPRGGRRDDRRLGRFDHLLHRRRSREVLRHPSAFRRRLHAAGARRAGVHHGCGRTATARCSSPRTSATCSRCAATPWSGTSRSPAPASGGSVRRRRSPTWSSSRAARRCSSTGMARGRRTPTRSGSTTRWAGATAASRPVRSTTSQRRPTAPSGHSRSSSCPSTTDPATSHRFTEHARSAIADGAFTSSIASRITRPLARSPARFTVEVGNRTRSERHHTPPSRSSGWCSPRTCHHPDRLNLLADC